MTSSACSDLLLGAAQQQSYGAFCAADAARGDVHRRDAGQRGQGLDLREDDAGVQHHRECRRPGCADVCIALTTSTMLPPICFSRLDGHDQFALVPTIAGTIFPVVPAVVEGTPIKPAASLFRSPARWRL